MAKSKGPLMSLSASGGLSPCLTFSRRKSGQQVRFQKKQKDILTIPRNTQRLYYKMFRCFWSSLPQSEKNIYNTVAKILKMSGYNYYMKQMLSDPSRYSGLQAYYSMNELTGHVVKDNTGNGFDGVLRPQYPSTCPARVSSFDSKHGNALSFSVNDYRVNISGDPVGLGAKTIICFIKPTLASCSNFGCMISNGKFRFSVRPDNRSYFSNNGINLVLPGYPNQITLNTWQCVGCTSNASGSIGKLFVNGLKTGPSSNAGSPIVSTSPYIIGIQETTLKTFAGYIDEIYIFNREFSDSEMLAFYNTIK